jgi:hypothetical protein
VKQNDHGSALVLGVFILLGLSALGYLLGNALIEFKEYERSVTVKGLAEREYPADVVIWPIKFVVAANDLESLYQSLEQNTATITDYLRSAGVADDEISTALPAITDKSAQRFDGASQPQFRYSAIQAVTVYSGDVDRVRGTMAGLAALGKQGIAFLGDQYQGQTEYLFTGLNDVKPGMIEEATKKARAVALEFAEDSDSSLGKIKRASQGQFSITPRDKNNPHIKKVRVVSTVEYYLSD